MITIRPARQSDKEWIVALLQEGAHNGHFAETVEGQAKQIFDQVVSKAWLITRQRRYGQQRAVFQFASILVSEVNGIPAGFTLCVTDHKETEIQFAGVKQEFRRQGCFHALVKHKIDLFNSSTLLNLLPRMLWSIAFFCAAICVRFGCSAPAYWNWRSREHRLFTRCYPISKIAISSFKKSGFSATPSNDGLIELTWLTAVQPA